MNRIAHPPRKPHAKPFGFDVCARMRLDQRGIAGNRRIDTTG